MAEASPPQTAPNAPWHFWLVGVLGMICGALGCYDFLMTNMRNADYIAAFTPYRIDFLDGFPTWLVMGWGIEMGCIVLGSFLLLSRSSWAVVAFGLSVFFMVASQAYQLTMGLPPSMSTLSYGSQVAIIWAIAVGLLVYANRMRTRRILH